LYQTIYSATALLGVSSISPRRDPHDMDRVADYAGWALFASVASGHTDLAF